MKGEMRKQRTELGRKHVTERGKGVGKKVLAVRLVVKSKGEET